MRIRILRLTAVLATLAVVGCGQPNASSLRESFAQQVQANRFIKEFQRNGEELLFTGPGTEGGVAKWRVRIDSAAIESNDDAKTASSHPYRGVVKSSWYADGQLVEAPTGRQPTLPFELVSNGLSQDCWALWEAAGERWTWE